MASRLQTARLSLDESLRLYEEADLLDLAQRADEVCRRLHGKRARTFAVDRNINFTNICECRCRFCAFWRAADSPEAYVLDSGIIAEKVREAVALGATHILAQGGVHPGLGIEFYEDLFRAIRGRFDVRIHALSPPEVHALARREGLSVRQTLERLRAAGLDSLPGGGAEILADRVRRLISPRKCSAGEWLGVMREAHALGMSTSATMVFGHVETPAERIGHLLHLRDLQDETGGFQSFIAWPFQAGGTDLARSGDLGPDWRPVTGAEYLRIVATARIVLDNIPNVQASWVTMGPLLGQAALWFGANDLGSTMIEENVVAAARLRPVGSAVASVTAAGVAPTNLSRGDLERLIRSAGFEPVQRDCTYRPVGR
ncbi:MAG TPA: cyclic dehypoxanthinyl futalosine synthase [Phycisphaerae bacterium]|nr:cyclic dehypoxanthinyl futalosine synthase [Phycisphaerae bacterium]